MVGPGHVVGDDLQVEEGVHHVIQEDRQGVLRRLWVRVRHPHVYRERDVELDGLLIEGPQLAIV